MTQQQIYKELPRTAIHETGMVHEIVKKEEEDVIVTKNNNGKIVKERKVK